MKFDLAEFFNKQREIIEAAETPFAKLAIFILPILAPLVPATLTGLHLFKLFLEIFPNNPTISGVLATLVAGVLEMLGYVGAISFIQSLYRLVKFRNPLYLLPTFLNGLAYAFYLILMFLVNYQLGEYFHTPRIINSIVGWLSFLTVPTGLLAANYLSQKEIKEDDREIRNENRQERLERARIKAGKLSPNLSESSQSFGKDVEKVTESSNENFPKDWRKLRPTLSDDAVRKIANLSSEDVKKLSQTYKVDERTVINWRLYARKELGI